LILLLWQQRRAGSGRKLLVAGGWLTAGLLVGCLPMILHWIFRAPTWPFTMTLDSHFPDAAAEGKMFDILIHRIIPTLFSYGYKWWGPTSYQGELAVIWLGATVTGYIYFLKCRRAELTPMDHGWFWGPLIVLAIMLTHTNMIGDSSNRRYCVQMVEAAIWLFCRFCVPVPRNLTPQRSPVSRAPLLLAVGLCALLLASSLVGWGVVVTEKLSQNTQYKLVVRRLLVPELQRHHAVIIADYWDAYMLLFLSEGQLRVEAQPWFWVRTYGRISAAEMQSNTLWLVREGVSRGAINVLIKDLGPTVLDKMTIIPVSVKILGRSCELWRLTDTNAAVTLMQKYHPRYFTTPYPPGSAPDRASPR